MLLPFPPPRSPPKPLHTSLPVIQGVFSSLAKKVRSQSRRLSGKKRGGDMYDGTSSLANKKKAAKERATITITVISARNSPALYIFTARDDSVLSFLLYFLPGGPFAFFRAPDLQEANFVSLAPPRVLLFRRKTATCFSAPCLTRRGAKERQGAEVGEKVEEALRSRCHTFALVQGQENRRSFQELSRQKR